MDRAWELLGSVGIGLDFTNATLTSPAIFLGPEQSIAFDGATNGTFTRSLAFNGTNLTYTTGSGGLVVASTSPVQSFAVTDVPGNVSNGASVNFYWNEIYVLDNTYYPGVMHQSSAMEFEYRMNPGNYNNVNGGFDAIFTHGLLANPTIATNTNRNYVGALFDAEIANGDGGFATTTTGTNSSGATTINVAAAGTVNTTDQVFVLDDSGVWEKFNVASATTTSITVTAGLTNTASTGNAVDVFRGGAFAYSAYNLLDAPSTYMRTFSNELDIAATTGSSSAGKSVLSLVAIGTDAVQGTIWDSALEISSTGGSVGWRNLIEVSMANGKFPLSSSGCVLCIDNSLGSGGYTIGRGIDFGSFTTITGNAFNFKNGSISGAGLYTGTGFNAPLYENLTTTQTLFDFTSNASNIDQILLCRYTVASQCAIDVMEPNTSGIGVNIQANSYGGSINVVGAIQGNSLVAAAAAATVTAGQVSLGGTVSAATSCGSLTGAAGCLIINVAGTTHYVPYY